MRCLLVLAVSYMVSSNAYAEVSDRVVLSFGIGAGYPVYVEAITPFGSGGQVRSGFGGAGTSTSIDSWNSGVHIGGSLGYVLDKQQKFILSSSVNYTGYIMDVTDGLVVRADQSADVVSVFTDLKVRLRSGEAMVIPYVKGGVGLFRTSREDRIRNITNTQNKVGFGLDAGVDLALSERAGFFAEAQYQVGLTDGKKTQHVPFKVGVFLR